MIVIFIAPSTKNCLLGILTVMVSLLLLFLSCLQGLFGHIQPDETPVAKYLKPYEGAALHPGIDGVEALYVINLDERPEKWSRMEDILSSQGLTPIRFPAIKGWHLPPGV